MRDVEHPKKKHEKVDKDEGAREEVLRETEGGGEEEEDVLLGKDGLTSDRGNGNGLDVSTVEMEGVKA